MDVVEPQLSILVGLSYAETIHAIRLKTYKDFNKAKNERNKIQHIWNCSACKVDAEKRIEHA